MKITLAGSSLAKVACYDSTRLSGILKSLNFEGIGCTSCLGDLGRQR